MYTSSRLLYSGVVYIIVALVSYINKCRFNVYVLVAILHHLMKLSTCRCNKKTHPSLSNHVETSQILYDGIKQHTQ